MESSWDPASGNRSAEADSVVPENQVTAICVPCHSVAHARNLKHSQMCRVALEGLLLYFCVTWTLRKYGRSFQMRLGKSALRESIRN